MAISVIYCQAFAIVKLGFCSRRPLSAIVYPLTELIYEGMQMPVEECEQELDW